MEKPEAARIVQRELVADAQDATDNEHEMTFLQAIQLYPKAVGWSVIMSAALIMDGYDTKLISGLIAQPAFTKAYGTCSKSGACQVSAPWQSGLNNGSNVGQIMGLVVGGYFTELLGFRKTMMMALCLVPCFIFIQFFAPSLPVLEVGQILLGIPLGMFQTVTTVYAVEVMPTCLRAYLTSYVNMCWVIGQLISAGVLRGTLNMTSSWGYRVPFAIQWFWPIPLLIGTFFAPESPWWLVRKNRVEEAKVSLRRLVSPRNVAFDIDKNVALMVLTTEHERELNASTSYAACFRGTDRRRTIIVMGCYCMQVLSGSSFRAYPTYFFQQAGLPTAQAFNMSIVVYVLAFAGVVIAWFLIPHFGRRVLYMAGLTGIMITFIIIGGLGVPQSNSPTSALAWAIGALLLVTVVIFDATIGPLAYTLASEIPSSLLRSKSVVIARFSYAVINIAGNVLTPYQLNPTAWNWGARAGFFWGGSAFLGLLFTYFFIPEPKDRTTAELDLLFERKTPATKFSKAQVNISEVLENHVAA